MIQFRHFANSSSPTETPREWWGRILAFHEPNEPQPLRDEYDTIIGTIIKPSLLGTVWCQSVMERFDRSRIVQCHET